MSYQVTSSGGINVGNMNAITINAQQIGHISSGMMSDDLSEPSSPDSSSFDASDLLSNSVHDDVTAQLAAAGVCWSILNSVPASQGWFELKRNLHSIFLVLYLLIFLILLHKLPLNFQWYIQTIYFWLIKGPIGVAAAAAIASSKKRKHPHHFETNPSKRKRQQTRLLRYSSCS